MGSACKDVSFPWQYAFICSSIQYLFNRSSVKTGKSYTRSLGHPICTFIAPFVRRHIHLWWRKNRTGMKGFSIVFFRILYHAVHHLIHHSRTPPPTDDAAFFLFLDTFFFCLLRIRVVRPKTGRDEDIGTPFFCYAEESWVIIPQQKKTEEKKEKFEFSLKKAE